ncbi:MAG: hypothetical protein CNLJKLNK_00622 [Holosporales bacterium]
MKQIYFFILCCLFMAENSHSSPLDFIKRGGKNCTGVCDQEQVCLSPKQIEWCQANCGHKMDISRFCDEQNKSQKNTLVADGWINQDMLYTLASNACENAYKFGINGGHIATSPYNDFTEVGHFFDPKTETVAWAGIKDDMLFIAFRGTKSGRDIKKDTQLLIANTAGKLGLGQLFSRGDYNNTILAGIKFYKDISQKYSGLFNKVVLTGHSLGGGIAQNVKSRVGASNPAIRLITINAPGTEFANNEHAGEIVNADNLSFETDVVSAVGKHAGKTVKFSGGGANPLKAHSSNRFKDHLEEQQRNSEVVNGITSYDDNGFEVLDYESGLHTLKK